MTESFYSDCLYYILISVGSSTDNFSVGLSVGLSKGDKLPFFANLTISICNALGAYVSSGIGSQIDRVLSPFLGESSIAVTYFIAGVAFFYLAYEEYTQFVLKRKLQKEWKKENKGYPPIEEHQLDMWSVFKLAIPMTLNNVAGGVAGGSTGMVPEKYCLAAFIASFTLMQIGFMLGKRIKKIGFCAAQHTFETEILSSSLYSILGFCQLYDCFSTLQSNQSS